MISRMMDCYDIRFDVGNRTPQSEGVSVMDRSIGNAAILSAFHEANGCEAAWLDGLGCPAARSRRSCRAQKPVDTRRDEEGSRVLRMTLRAKMYNAVASSICSGDVRDADAASVHSNACKRLAGEVLCSNL